MPADPKPPSPPDASPPGASPLRALPKVELHRHLDGSVRVSEKKAVLGTPRASLQSVLDSFSTQQAALCSFETISRITMENIEDAWLDGVRLLELRFAPNDEIIGGVLDGMVRGMATWPVQVGLIGILPRRYPAAAHAQATADLIRWKASGAPGASRICGFDLADDPSLKEHPLPALHRAALRHSFLPAEITEPLLQ